MSKKIGSTGLLLGAFALAWLAPAAAQAQTTSPGPVYVSILDDSTDKLYASLNAPGGPGGLAGTYTNETNPIHITGFDPSANGNIVDEKPGPAPGGSLGSVSLHFSYMSSVVFAPGQNVHVNFNIFDPTGAELSDTLAMSIQGIQPGSGDNNNMVVDLTFLSDNESIPLVPLFGGITVNEVQGGYVDLTSLIQTATAAGAGGVGTGLTDLHIRFNSSDIPEPGTVSLVAVAGVFAGAAAWRRRRTTKRDLEKAAV